MATWVGLPASYTPGRPRPIQYVVIHATEGSEGPTSAEDGHHYDTVRTDGTSTHLFVDQNSALREVQDADQAHAARQHGNAIGVQVELCGLAGQTWAQWHDGASTAELALAAAEVAQICRDHAIPAVHLSVAQVRAAYYAPAGQRPKGICAHNDVTGAYPEDGGTHTDPGPNFPWAEFLAMVSAHLAPTPTPPPVEDDMPTWIVTVAGDPKTADPSGDPGVQPGRQWISLGAIRYLLPVLDPQDPQRAGNGWIPLGAKHLPGPVSAEVLPEYGAIAEDGDGALPGLALTAADLDAIATRVVQMLHDRLAS